MHLCMVKKTTSFFSYSELLYVLIACIGWCNKYSECKFSACEGSSTVLEDVTFNI